MKQFIKLLLLVMLVFTLPLPTFAEEWGKDGRNVGEMLDDEDINDVEREIEDNDSKTSVETENDEQEENILPGSDDQSVIWMLFQTVIALAVILFLIYALLKFFNKRSKTFGGHSSIERIGGVSLGTNKSVQIVRIGDKLFVVGVGESIHLIKEITDDDEVEKILDEHAPAEAFDQPVLKVTEWLQGRFGRKKMSEPNNDSFQSLLKRELNEVKDSQKKAHTVLKEKDHD